MAASRRTTEAPPRPWSRRGRISERPWCSELTTVPLQLRTNASPFCIMLLLSSTAFEHGMIRFRGGNSSNGVDPLECGWVPNRSVGRAVAEFSLAERLIGTVRRECVDHIVTLGETNLRRTLRQCARYYNS